MLNLRTNILIEGGSMVFDVELPSSAEGLRDLLVLAHGMRQRATPMRLPNLSDFPFARDVEQVMAWAGFERDDFTAGDDEERWVPRAAPPAKRAAAPAHPRRPLRRQMA